MALLAPPSAIASVTQQPSTQLELATNRLIPLVFGSKRVGGLLFAFDKTTTGSGDSAVDTVTMGVLWAMGEQASVTSLKIDGEDPVSGVLQNHYTGTLDQAADTLLAAKISGYTDTLVIAHAGYSIGLCYSVIQYTNSHYDHLIQPTAVLGGMTSTLTPVDVIQRVFQDSLFGDYITLDTKSINESLAFSRETITKGSDSERRTSFSGVIEQQVESGVLAQALSNYAQCHMFIDGDRVYVRPLQYQAPSKTVTEFDLLEPVTVKRQPLRNQPNEFITRWSENELVPSSVFVRSPELAANEEAARTSELDMRGYDTHSQAYRHTHFRYQYLRQVISYEIRGWESLFTMQQGDTFVLDAYNIKDNCIVESTPSYSSEGVVTVRARPYSSKFFHNSLVDCPVCDMDDDIWFDTPAEIKLPPRADRVTVAYDWTNQEYDVGIPPVPEGITHAELHWTQSGVEHWKDIVVSSSTHSFSISGSIAGLYTFQLRWVNDDGYGRLSFPTSLAIYRLAWANENDLLSFAAATDPLYVQE